MTWPEQRFACCRHCAHWPGHVHEEPCPVGQPDEAEWLAAEGEPVKPWVGGFLGAGPLG